MKQKAKFILFIAIAGIVVVVTGKILAEPTKSSDKELTKSVCECASGCIKCVYNNKSEVDLKTAMRKLWEDHVTWTRNVIFCIMDDLQGTDQAVNRLLKNQEDIGDAIKPYYGNDAGKKLTELLKTHITTAADLLKAAKSDNKAVFDDANKKWFENADRISEFLSKANPNWKLEDMKTMMHDHLKFTTDEAVARKNKNFDEDVKDYDNVHNEILKMSDMLSDGIVKQFPDKFKNMSMGMSK
jgi:hypothetical protein